MGDFLTNDDGFSLLELLVAMAVLSMAIVPMVGNQGSLLRNVARLQDKELAMMVAENIAVTLTVQKQMATAGYQAGNSQQGGIRYQWSANSRQVTGQKMMMTSIDVKKAGGADILASLTTSQKLK